MDSASARAVIHQLAKASGDPNDQWKDPTHVATTEWRAHALDVIKDPKALDPALVELELSDPHPAFTAIIRVDDRGIWYSDGDGPASEAT